jgi:hypothetical protein
MRARPFPAPLLEAGVLRSLVRSADADAVITYRLQQTVSEPQVYCMRNNQCLRALAASDGVQFWERGLTFVCVLT